MNKLIKKELEQYNCVAYWWNMKSKTLDFKGNLYDFLKHNKIQVRKLRNTSYDCFQFTLGNVIKLRQTGDVGNGAYLMLKLVYAYRGYKVTVEVQGREFSFNH